MATLYISSLPMEYQELASRIDNDEASHKQHNVKEYSNPAVKGDGMLSCWEFEKFTKELPEEVRRYNPYDTNPEARAHAIITGALIQKKAEGFIDKILAFFGNN